MKWQAGTITVSTQMLEDIARVEQVWQDILSGKRPWNPDAVDWDAVEAMHEDET